MNILRKCSRCNIPSILWSKRMCISCELEDAYKAPCSQCGELSILLNSICPGCYIKNDLYLKNISPTNGRCKSISECIAEEEG
jgi:hypothetical protein